MKRKPDSAEEHLVSKQILEQAKQAAVSDRIQRMARCVVCGTEFSHSSSPAAGEGLCWVCRRLKISAWRDNDVQMGAQE